MIKYDLYSREVFCDENLSAFLLERGEYDNE